MKLAEFFQDYSGKPSTERLNSSLCIWTAIGMVIVSVAGGPPVNYSVFTTLLAFGSGMKIWQKYIESKAEIAFISKTAALTPEPEKEPA